MVWDNFHQCHFDDDDDHQYHKRDGFDGGADESQRGKGTSQLVLCVKKDGWTTLNGKKGWLLQQTHLAVVAVVANPHGSCGAVCWLFLQSQERTRDDTNMGEDDSCTDHIVFLVGVMDVMVVGVGCALCVRWCFDSDHFQRSKQPELNENQ